MIHQFLASNEEDRKIKYNIGRPTIQALVRRHQKDSRKEMEEIERRLRLMDKKGKDYLRFKTVRV